MENGKRIWSNIDEINNSIRRKQVSEINKKKAERLKQLKPYAPVNRVFVTQDKIWNDEIVFESGVKLYKDITFEPEWHVATCGYVATLPLEFRKDRMNDGQPCQVEVGDKVYFHYFTLKEDENRVNIGNRDYFMVDYNRIYCKVVEDQVLPVHGFNLIEVVEEEKEGSINGIIIPEMLRKKKVDTYGKVVLPSSNAYNLFPGDTVFFQSAYAYKDKIEGKEYYIIHYQDIMAYQHDNKTSTI